MSGGIAIRGAPRYGVVWRWASALALGAAAFVYYGRAMGCRWYGEGPFLLDFGWFTDLVSGRTLTQDNPTAVGAFPYSAVHVAPILSVFAGLSRVLGLKGESPLVVALGCGFGGAAAMGFVVIERFLRPLGRNIALVTAAGVALVYAVCGVMRATADYPHIEILYVPTALLTLHLLFQGRLRWAWAALALCLSCREDAGLHLATILGAYLMLATLEERGVPARLRDLAGPLAVCLVYPALAILWQRTAYPDMSTFVAIYAGTPPFRHLTAPLLETRLSGLAGVRAWVPLTMLGSASGLLFLPRWTALTGLAACLPWFALNLIANSEAAGNFMVYYGFPFLVTALAPFIVLAAAPPPPRETLDVLPF